MRDSSTGLIETNLGWLRQALSILEQLDDRTFATSPAGMAPHRAGGHLRHVLEFYECFLDGLDTARIDYDKRKRNEAVESSRRAAADRIRWIIERLTDEPRLRRDSRLSVRVEDAQEDA